jgi:6-pyruvoyl-tetrahydropterin synthase
VDLELTGNVDSKGMVLGLDFGHVKKIWRAYLDTNFDHHLCLNGTDPLVGMIIMSVPPHAEAFESDDDPQLVVARDILKDWGITIMSMDPTVENMARVWGMWAAKTFQSKVAIKVNEAATNAATWRSY